AGAPPRRRRHALRRLRQADRGLGQRDGRRIVGYDSRRMAATYDAIIIGGGPAGLSTALHLQARAPKLRALVVEAETYPREKICAGGVGARALRILDKLGVAIDCPMVPLDAIALRYAGDTAIVRERGLGVVVRRVEFDHALARQVAARGIELRDGCRVASIVRSDDDVRVALATGEE